MKSVGLKITSTQLRATRVVSMGFLCLMLAGCSLLLKPVIGVKNPKLVEDKKIEKYTRKWGISSPSAFKIDTAKYFELIPLLEDSSHKLLQDLYQPLQVRGYNKKGEMELFLINCNIGGFPNLDWNRLGSFDSFPPVMASFKRIDTSFTLTQDLKYYMTMDKRPLDHGTFSEADYTLVIYWAIFMGRQSEILITQVEEYKRKFADKKLNLIYINTDNLYAAKSKVESY